MTPIRNDPCRVRSPHVAIYEAIMKRHTRETVTQDIVGRHAVGITTP